jgi:hypothetical protein
MNNEQFDEFLDGALKRHANAPQDIEAPVARVITRLAGPLPRQKMPLWRLPAVLLDWQFAPAWPRMTALGACAAIGFVVGISGIDRRIDRLDVSTAVASNAGIGSLVFEPEELTGARP